MKFLFRSLRLPGLVLVLLGALLNESASADEHYFAMIFGSQSKPKQLRYTHTWGIFVRAVGEGPNLSTYNLELSTISWLPRTLDIKVLRPWPEPGINLDLYQTLDTIQANRESIIMWGPVVIGKELRERSLVIRGILGVCPSIRLRST